MKEKDPMLDEEFLKELDLYPHKFTWAKIIALNWEEYPMQEITGRITSGSINVDGASAVRRTCSLSLVANDVDINNFYWSLNTKFRVEVGLENWINSDYPDIIWFNQGMFIISSFNCSVGVNNYSISISGKDKMVLLNGDVGGVIPASWDFGTEDETLEDGTIQNNLIPIKDIILQGVHEFAQEPWQNIIVNDLDDYGIELLEYIGDNPLYYIITEDGGDNDSREVYQMTIYGDDVKCQVRQDAWNVDHREIGTDWGNEVSISEMAQGTTGQLCYEGLMEQLDPTGAVTESENYMPAVVKISGDNGLYRVARISKEDGTHICGYRICDIVYPYDLILSPGETITAMLDKLVQMLGNFEYFYDVDGRFVFQKKRTYLDVSYNNIINEHTINDTVWANSGEYSSKYSYTFDDNILVSSVSNAPNLSNLKNDYSLWGSRKQGDIEVPIHMRYAIDHRPVYYKTWDGVEYAVGDNVTRLDPESEVQIVDWREIIYRMANDYRRHYRDDDFLIKIRDNNKYNNYDSYYPKGYTGYEKYYIDFEMNLSQGVVAYWRELYNPEAKGKTVIYQPDGSFIENTGAEWVENTPYAKGDLVEYQGNVYRSIENNNTTEPTAADAKWLVSLGDFSYNSEGWNNDILKNPEMLNFWFDFLDTTGELNKYSVSNIGQRSKAVNDDKIKAIYFRETPNVIFETEKDNVDQSKWRKPGYAHIKIPVSFNDLFAISSRGKNAMDVVEEYLYTYTYPASAMTLNVVPIYYLTPNTLIYINDKETGAIGEYIMQKFSIQLGLNAQMSINAIETAKRIY